MIGKLLLAGALATIPAWGQNEVRHVTRFWGPDGAGVELYTETEGPSRPADTLANDKARLDAALTKYSPLHPTVIQLKAKIAQDEAVLRQQTTISGGGSLRDDGKQPLSMHRLVFDGRNDVVFAYELEIKHAAQAGAVNIRIKPASLTTHYPTVSAMREFIAVNVGQEVTLEMLADPNTGEKVYDVLRPIAESNPYGGAGIQSAERPLEGITLVVNGQTLTARNSWRVGQPALLYIPGQGGFYLSWNNLDKYRVAGYVEKNRMIVFIDSQYIEVTSAANILAASEHGPVWVYHDPNYRPETGADRAQLTVFVGTETPHARKSR